jgi:hypothetical protein
VIGAVAGVVVVSGCERLRLSVACRKLVAHNCLECEFSVATLSPSIISGDTRSLVFGESVSEPVSESISQLVR